MIDHTHDPALTSWIESANLPDTDFPIQNLPFATFHRPGADALRVGVAIGDQVLDASAAFDVRSLRGLMAQSREQRLALRHRISSFLSKYSNRPDRFLVPQNEVTLLLPCEIRDYTDFYASIDHATNVGRMLRPDQPLLPNYKWIPIGYHGRASSIVVSGSPVVRPLGQLMEAGAAQPRYAPTRRLDYEVEIGAFLGPGNQHGHPIPIGRAEDHLFGVCLLNDWSARDVQAWEYQPLGPFLAKSFATSISPWVVTLEALAPFRCSPPARPDGDPQPLPYLQSDNKAGAFQIQIEAWIRTSGMTEPTRLTHTDFSAMYWTLAQLITHHASNGCPLRPGDLIGSGTVSGPKRENRGCLLELTGRDGPLKLPNGETRSFLEDGDEITMRGWCEIPGRRRIGLGSCSGSISPAANIENN